MDKCLKHHDDFKRVLRRCRLVVLMEGNKWANIGFTSLLSGDGPNSPKDYELFDIVNDKNSSELAGFRLTDDIFFEKRDETIHMLFFGSNWAKGDSRDQNDRQNGSPNAGLSAFFQLDLKLDSELVDRASQAKPKQRKDKAIEKPTEQPENPAQDSFVLKTEQPANPAQDSLIPKTEQPANPAQESLIPKTEPKVDNKSGPVQTGPTEEDIDRAIDHAESRFNVDPVGADDLGDGEGSDPTDEEDLGSEETENSEDFYASEAKANNVYVIDDGNQKLVTGTGNNSKGKADLIIID